jgi:hypothetical protein
LQVDPIEGGTTNDYAYVNDPINQNDYSGQFGLPKWVKKLPTWAQVAVCVVVVVVIVVIVAAAIVSLPAEVVGAAIVRAATAVAPRIATVARGTTSPAATQAEQKGAVAAQRVTSYTGPAGPVAAQTTANGVGSRLAPLISDRTQLYQLGNTATTISNRMYTAHAQDSMQCQGIYPSVVENTIKYGQRVPSSDETTDRFYDFINNITAVVDKTSGRVVTTFFGDK